MTVPKGICARGLSRDEERERERERGRERERERERENKLTMAEKKRIKEDKKSSISRNEILNWIKK